MLLFLRNIELAQTKLQNKIHAKLGLVHGSRTSVHAYPLVCELLMELPCFQEGSVWCVNKLIICGGLWSPLNPHFPTSCPSLVLLYMCTAKVCHIK